ncbi:MATE efflux family protein [Mycobacterium xenopi 3993]|nr:MATE efflux family protein [Mycobacterium xenopi 3993]
MLAAEPLYLLFDTAVVGRLGAVSLAGLAIGALILGLVGSDLTFLSYGTTARSARYFGAGDRAAAVAEGVQATWLALGLGALIVIVVEAVAVPVVSVVGSRAEIATAALPWLRIAILGAPAILVSLAGNGWLRGVQDTVRPLRYVVAGFGLSALLCRCWYTAGWACRGWSWPVRRWPTSPASGWRRCCSAAHCWPNGCRCASTAACCGPAGDGPRPGGANAGLSGVLCVRGGGSGPVRCRRVRGASGRAAVVGISCAGSRFAGHRGAGTGRAALGASQVSHAKSVARRVTMFSAITAVALAAPLALGASALPRLFTDDPAVLAVIGVPWWFLVAQLPVAGTVFGLDGVLLGAGDARFMRTATVVSALAGFLPLIWLSLVFGWGWQESGRG